MTPVAITPSQVIAQVEAILRKDSGARTIGIRSPGPWRGSDAMTIGEFPLRVHYCASPLAVREQLTTPCDGDEIRVLLTPLDEQMLGQDVLARLWKQRLIAIQSWRIVLDLFQVEEIDARLHKQSWMANALLYAQPMEGYPPVSGRVLTAEFVWQLLLKRYLGFDQPRVDAIELARWAKDRERVAFYQQAPDELRKNLPNWLAESTGEVGRVMLAALELGHGADLIPLGLVCQVVFDSGLTQEPALVTAAARLEERFLNGASLHPDVGRGWGAAVAAVVESDLARRTDSAIRDSLCRAEEILDEIKAGEGVIHSPILPRGLERRLEAVAKQILESIATGNTNPLSSLEEAVQFALEHRMGNMQSHRADGVRMAVRLVRWLRDSSSGCKAGSFQDAVVQYFNNSGFVDWARYRIWDGDSNPVLANAYGKLALRVDECREVENRHFGGLIQDWSQHPVSSPATVWIEKLLDQVVSPLAKERPVLLLVLDGMSVAVFRELHQDLHLQGWVELGLGENGERNPVIAVLPTRTEVSRASLLAGRLTSGDSTHEKECFRKHEALRASGRSNFPPTLYHKGELTVPGGRGLAPEVRAEIAGIDRRVIGVVINTVDDNLAKGGQFRETWTTETIVPLGHILDAAREANRVIIMTSDHGHVLERDLAYRTHENAQERSRPPVGPPAADEVILQGPRVWPQGEKIIVPWSEKVRYGIKKYGYHGGVSPQEVVVPLAVFHSGFRQSPAPNGWLEVASNWPIWWEKAETIQAQSLPKSTIRKGESRKKSVPETAPNLFSGMETPWSPPSVPSRAPVLDVGWITALLQSPIYQEQRQMCARTALDDAKVQRFLELLDARGGKMTRTALATTMQIPRMRFPGMLAGLRRQLNVDGYAIMEVNDHADMVELNKKLLFTQFELKDDR